MEVAIYDFKTKTQIVKGWSNDKKYCVATSDGEKYLLHISKIDQQERKKVDGDPWQEFDRIVWSAQKSQFLF